MQVTTKQKVRVRKKGKSERANARVIIVEKATGNFIEIAYENPDITGNACS